MTTTAPLARPARPAPAAERPTAVALGARLRWSWRLIRRGAVLMWLTVALYMAMEVLVFAQAYPDEASRQRLRELSASTAVRMLQGPPSGVDTAGGFAVWDGGWMLMVIIGCWALLTTTRVTRGEEDTGRAEVLLSGPQTPRELLAGHLVAMLVAAGGIGASAALAFVVLGEAVTGAVLWGLGLAAFTCVVAGLAALLAQLAEPRRRVASAGLALVAAGFLLRVIANSADRRAWLLTAGPFGWVDRLRAFAGDRWLWLLPPVTAAALLGGGALVLAGRRDAGAAFLRMRIHGRSRLRLLSGPAAFVWRLTSPALAAWAVLLAVVSFVFGLMTQAIVDFINEDESYRRLLESMGMDMSEPVVGFMSYMAIFLALPFAAFVGWRLGAVRQEEADGRLDNLLVRGVVRWRWLTVVTAHAFFAATLLEGVTGIGLWAGARAVNAPISVSQILEPLAGTLPLVALFTGLAVLTLGIAPRLTVVVPVTVAVLGYLLDTFGAALKWPRSVLAVSPFHHLARLPGMPMSALAVLVMTALGLAAAGLGIAAYSRRDVLGS